MRGAIPPLPQYAFMVWGLVKHRDNFTFTFLLLQYSILREIHGKNGSFDLDTTWR
jgi:hypothetical protein